jgi:hypothetical protein
MLSTRTQHHEARTICEGTYIWLDTDLEIAALVRFAHVGRSTTRTRAEGRQASLTLERPLSGRGFGSVARPLHKGMNRVSQHRPYMESSVLLLLTTVTLGFTEAPPFEG